MAGPGFEQPHLPRPMRGEPLPVKGTGMYFARTRPTVIDPDDVRAVGDAVPEAFDWPERQLRAALSAKTLEFKQFFVKESEIEILVANLTAKSAQKVANQLGLDEDGSVHELRERISAHFLGL